MSLSHKMLSGNGLAFLSAFVLLTMVWPERAGAIPITYNFTGAVTESYNLSGVNAGDPLSGTLSYDTDIPPYSSPDEPPTPERPSGAIGPRTGRTMSASSSRSARGRSR